MHESDNQRQRPAAEMHRRTAELIAAAGAIGDTFLQYLYEMALRHLEEQAGLRNEKMGECTRLVDPAIEEVAARLKALAKTERG